MGEYKRITIEDNECYASVRIETLGDGPRIEEIPACDGEREEPHLRASTFHILSNSEWHKFQEVIENARRFGEDSARLARKETGAAILFRGLLEKIGIRK